MERWGVVAVIQSLGQYEQEPSNRNNVPCIPARSGWGAADLEGREQVVPEQGLATPSASVSAGVAETRGSRFRREATVRSITERSPARAVGALLPYDEALALKASVGGQGMEETTRSVPGRERIRALLLEVVATSDRRRLVSEIRAPGKVAFEAEPGDPTVLIEVDAGGRRRRGRFQGRSFVPSSDAPLAR